MANILYFGDNLHVLRQHIADGSVDLVYLDPPFNSNASYNVLFATPEGRKSHAQTAAFEDTWHWGDEAEAAYDAVLRSGTALAPIVRGFRSILSGSDMMAYLTMMAVRLIELHRVLKSTGSLYLHCDATASHYLKLLLDGIFGPDNFRSEITWKRTTSHGNVSRNYGAVADHILFYSKSDSYTWNQVYSPFEPAYIEEKFRWKDRDGRRWQSVTLRNPSPRPNLVYEYLASNGVIYRPHPNGWSCDIVRMRKYDGENRLHFPDKPDGKLRLKMYLDESPGIKAQNIWSDIPAVNSRAIERIGYPTQKPLALLNRIVTASTNRGDVILDPFIRNTIGWSFPPSTTSVISFPILPPLTLIMPMSARTIPGTQDQYSRGRAVVCVRGQTGNRTNAGWAITPFMFNEEGYCVSIPQARHPTCTEYSMVRS